MENSFSKIITSLRTALFDDFRGFLCEGTERIEVPDNTYHLQIAFQEMKKIPGYVYTSGTGQNPTIEYMQQKRAIYITKIPLSDAPDQFQRTVGYLTDVYSDIVEYQGIKQPIYEVLKRIALEMGYDVDEYTLEDSTKSNVKTPASIKIYKSLVEKNKPTSKISPKRSLKNGDQPVFDPNNVLMGFISNGKFASIRNYNRYSPSEIKQSTSSGSGSGSGAINPNNNESEKSLNE